jgi:hypothetical protein
MTLFYSLPGYYVYHFTLVALNFKLNWMYTFKKVSRFWQGIRGDMAEQ